LLIESVARFTEASIINPESRIRNHQWISNFKF